MANSEAEIELLPTLIRFGDVTVLFEEVGSYFTMTVRRKETVLRVLSVPVSKQEADSGHRQSLVHMFVDYICRSKTTPKSTAKRLNAAFGGALRKHSDNGRFWTVADVASRWGDIC